jgi:predicted phosphodiesterase
MRIALIADTHVASRAPECLQNWDVAAGAVVDLHADLTLHLGDITLGRRASAGRSSASGCSRCTRAARSTSASRRHGCSRTN